MSSSLDAVLKVPPPHSISLHFDGEEVQRFEAGQLTFLVFLPASYSPQQIQLFWDGQLVYELHPHGSRVAVNQLSMSQSSTPPC